MLLLNIVSKALLQVYSNFNTSYVVIKLALSIATRNNFIYFNTSYVVIKPNASMANARVQAFQYILCCY